MLFLLVQDPLVYLLYRIDAAPQPQDVTLRLLRELSDMVVRFSLVVVEISHHLVKLFIGTLHPLQLRQAELIAFLDLVIVLGSLSVR